MERLYMETQDGVKTIALTLFLNHMVQKYQNEIAPIFYYGKSPKTNEKDLKIPNLRPPD